MSGALIRITIVIPLNRYALKLGLMLVSRRDMITVALGI